MGVLRSLAEQTQSACYVCNRLPDVCPVVEQILQIKWLNAEDDLREHMVPTVL
jgi:hypothetical protein